VPGYLDDAVAGKLRGWMLVNGCSLGTASKGVRYLRFLERERELTFGAVQPAQDEVLEFLATWRQQGIKPRTLNSWIRELNLWSRFQRLGWKMAYFRQVTPPQIRVPDEKTASRLLALSWPDRAVDARNRAIIALMVQVGIRRDELLHLELRDLTENEDGPVLQIRHAKGEKQRPVPVTPQLAAQIHEYVELYRSRKHPVRLFTTREGSLSYGYLGRIIQRAGAQVGAPWLSPHKLRHFACDYMMDHGMSVGSVAEILGHARWETTQLYRQRRLARRQMEREFRALPPLSPKGGTKA
jgi:integrase